MTTPEPNARERILAKQYARDHAHVDTEALAELLATYRQEVIDAFKACRGKRG